LKIMTTLAGSYSVLGTSGASHTAAARAGSSLLQRLIAWYGEQRRYRRTLNELLALSDRELNDIGVSRSDVEAVARRSARAL
jgi:uncharacterized protein YjiS (DUF1127 family)